MDHDVRRRAVITVTLVSTGGLLVRSPGTGPDAPDVAHLQSGGESVLPGTSLAGALRARALRIANVVRSRQGDGPKWVNQVFGPTVPYGHADAETRLNASKIVVHESPLTAGHRLQPARIRIDRFTGGALEGALLEEEPHYLGKAQVRLELRSHQDAELGLLLLTLKDLITEDLPVGGSSSVGRGFLKGRVTLQVDGTECAFGDGMSSDAPSREKLEAYVKAFHNATPLEETSQ